MYTSWLLGKMQKVSDIQVRGFLEGQVQKGGIKNDIGREKKKEKALYNVPSYFFSAFKHLFQAQINLSAEIQDTKMIYQYSIFFSKH